ncbi:MAG TPA: hypothetical protein PK252_00385 [Bacteroidales bacterium]|nr:hypothetical protein [Bacteroidales bacterium]
MSINNVGVLFRQMDERDELRQSIYRCKNKGELVKILDMHQMSFTIDEFEEAANVFHAKCQSQEEADWLFGKVNWFRFLYYSLAN